MGQVVQGNDDINPKKREKEQNLNFGFHSFLESFFS
jgi:hypothetical protein